MEDGDIVEVRSPFDGRVVGRVTRARRDHAEAAITASVKAFGTTRRLPAFERQRVLRRVAAAVAASRRTSARTIVQEAGKPIKLARIEVDRAVFIFNVAAEEATRIYGEYLPLDWQEFTAGRRQIAKRYPRARSQTPGCARAGRSVAGVVPLHLQYRRRQVSQRGAARRERRRETRRRLPRRGSPTSRPGTKPARRIPGDGGEPGQHPGAAGVLAGLATVAGMRRAGFVPGRDITVLAIRAEEAGAWFPTSYPRPAALRLPPRCWPEANARPAHARPGCLRSGREDNVSRCPSVRRAIPAELRGRYSP